MPFTLGPSLGPATGKNPRGAICSDAPIVAFLEPCCTQPFFPQARLLYDYEAFPLVSGIECLIACFAKSEFGTFSLP